MATKSLNGVLQHVRVLAAVQTGRALTDPELLERFVGQKDEAAFTVLIERHGPMVLGVCRRALKHSQDAEDACQATFLVFARKAGSIRKTTALGSWLHGIACRISANLKRQQGRRRKREKQAALPPAQSEAASTYWKEAQTILDEELGQLPERYRAPLLLCYWEGKTRDEAATQLGFGTGKLHGLLERGRTLLRERLTQRGFTLSAALCASLLAGGTTNAALAPTLVVASIKAATSVAAGNAVTAATSANVAALTDGVLRTMFLTKIKIAAVALVVGMTALGGGMLTYRTAAAQGDKPANNEREVATGKGSEQSPKDKESKGDKELAGLDGRWDLVSEEHDGEQRTLMFKSYQVTFKGKEVTTAWVRDDDSNSSGGGTNQFIIDSTKNPKELTITGDNIKIQAVYKLEKDQLTIAFFGKPEDARPKGFTVADAAGDGHILVVRVLKRADQAKEGKASDKPPTTPENTSIPESARIKEAFTAWGKEVGGLQAGLGYRPDQKRAYSPGETVRLVVRVRNVGTKEEVKFQYLKAFFIETPPAVTDGDGKPVPLGRLTALGIHIPVEVNLAPGKEIDLAELKLEPRTGAQSVHERDWVLHETGKFSVQYEQLAHPNIDKILGKLATGTLELEIKFKSEPPAATGPNQEKPALPKAKDDKKTLQGIWKGETVELAGRPFVKKVELHVDGDQLTLRGPYWGTGLSVGPPVDNQFTFKVKSSKPLGEIDMTRKPDADDNASRVVLGVYVVEGDTLRVCLGLENKVRPKALKTSADSRAEVMLVLKRAVGAKWGELPKVDFVPKFTEPKAAPEKKNGDDRPDILDGNLLTLDKQLWDAAKTGDWKVYDRLLAKDYVGHSNLHGRSDKAATVASVKNSRYSDWTIRDLETRQVSKDVAIITYVHSCKVTSVMDGTVQTYRDHQTSLIWAQREGAWVLVFCQDAACSKASLPVGPEKLPGHK